MKKQTLNDIRLGAFVAAGLLILVVSLYLIGLNQNVFGSNFSLKARFSNVNGLMPGNNVRFAGIQCGTVKSIEIINDTTIEVSMLIREKTSVHIRKDAQASIGSEGLMGNKVVDIGPGASGVGAVANGDMLQPGQDGGINELMGDLSAAGGNALSISSDLRQTAARINGSPALNELLADTALARDLQQTLKNFRHTSFQLSAAARDMQDIISGVRKGRGVAGVLLTDAKAEQDIRLFMNRALAVAARAENTMVTLDSMSVNLHESLNQPGGLGYLLLKDSVAAKRITNSLQNVEMGTEAFSEDMEALKHNFLLRGYFKKQKKGK
jgi:phospholipid/cholesterol/gamma-HCH transport system substrate-binding protein